MTDKITPKQQRFIDVYDGDIKAAAKEAGLTYQYCRKLMSDEGFVHVQSAIATTESTKSNIRIATKRERQEFWSKVFRGEVKDGDEDTKMRDRLKASDLLGKSFADFTENLRHTGEDGGPVEIRMNIEGIADAVKCK